MKVMIIGIRGFPNVQGGVETHAEQLGTELVQLGCEVEAVVRSPYQPAAVGDHWNGIRFKSLWSPRSRGLEAIIHTTLAVLYAGWRRPDVLHIQAIGPGIVTPLARLLGLNVVATHHGPDYDRQKWGRFARAVLQLGERWSMRYSQQAIVISSVIKELVQRKHAVDAALIPNGVKLPALLPAGDTLARFGLDAGRYVLLVSRIVPEKRHLDLIQAYAQARLPGWKLVLVGASDHPDTYTQSVLDAAAAQPGVVCTGFQTGAALAELYANAGAFVLPSSHEGLPIALLEALSYGLPVVASDIPANLAVDCADIRYYPLGEIEALAAALEQVAAQPLAPDYRDRLRAFVGERYSWPQIARQTYALYRRACGTA
ncbi:Glycosyltransferase involved in cell wall bisynthesis [Duganella sacchari]|uniref:Glycosyltransferase involved in cell wall bisynthesis n=1 Tax=Duganella sacchari TaxID=551987 RepID=A0A1M7R0T0_9BURK|nr:glycosyltransferase family 4 protein [Duganella sacchari]SHN38033.1 Glycosyltransferase involved in cell wall bisynthesis [Duganella sacchari]